MNLTVATSQFSISANIQQNGKLILEQMRQAKEKQCDVIQFPECALSGYGPSHFDNYEGFKWDQLRACTEEIIAEAKNLGIWVILGSTHRLNGNKHHNSIYVIDNNGTIVDRYDKRFVAGDDNDSGELKYYAPGFLIFCFKKLFKDALYYVS
jgi:predicted amidohydrolase